jgi:hypothetical protein
VLSPYLPCLLSEKVTQRRKERRNVYRITSFVFCMFTVYLPSCGMKKTTLFLFLLLSFCVARSQTFTGSGGSIPDNGPVRFFPITVSGLPAVPLDSTFGVESVCMSIFHGNDYQLTIQLVAPDGTTIDLSMNNGGNGNNYSNTCLTGTSTAFINYGGAPFSGNYLAEGTIGNVNNGQQGNGIWQLKIQDQYSGSTGSVLNWSITFSNTPAFPLKLTSSNLPIVVINTNGQQIVDDPKRIVHMGIIDNGPGVRNNITDPFNSYDANIAIEIRGSYSQTFPQQQYGFETLDSLNTETDVSILGMPAESDWILYAPFNDKSCMRNVLAYDIANKTGHYASRTRFCEVVINNDYKGIYIMLEKIKRNINRVDISKLTLADTAATGVTGGYIVKIDKSTGSGGTGWSSNYDGVPGTPIKFQYEYPSDADILPQQAAYIQAYVDSFEDALNATWFADPNIGYRKYIDVSSFIDYFILNEACKNVDAYRISTFLYKKKITRGGKLFVGPAWDYNIAFWNANYCEGDLSSGWQYEFNNICGTPGDNNVPFWWAKLLQDPAYANALHCRWNLLRLTTLNTDTLLNEIDSIALMIGEAKDRHFTKWPILGVQVWANPTPVGADFAADISNMKNWTQQRVNWLDANMPGTCLPAAVDDIASNAFLSVYPNPYHNRFAIQFRVLRPGDVLIEIEDLTGRKVFSRKENIMTIGKYETSVAPGLSPGLYTLQIKTAANCFVARILAQ